MKTLTLPHGELPLPAFLPDATRGVVRSVDSSDLLACGVTALVMNTFHLMQKPGSSTVQALGGLHRMTGWDKPILTDSGGFQAYSLLRQNPKFGSLHQDGLTFQPEGADRKYQLSPEKAIQLQLGYGADIVVCLDDCTHVDDSLAAQEQAVARTIDWARRSRKAFDQQLAQKKLSPEQYPKLFAVVQGGGDFSLRRICAEALLDIGFDGYGYGGWPLDEKGNLLHELLAFVREIIPSQFPLHALGVGEPQNVRTCFELGYPMADSAMPTRDARHGRLFVWRADPAQPLPPSEWYHFLYIGDDKHIKSTLPISPHCDCPTCQRYSRGYLHHLFKIGDHTFERLVTQHNIRFMTRLASTFQHDT